MNSDSYSLNGYEPIDSIEQDAPLGHGVQQNFGADTRNTGHGKKSSFWKGKDGRQYARRKDGRIITHDAEALGGDDASLADFNGVESVVVEAPLGHGVTQYYAEGDSQSFNAYDEPITDRQGYKIKKLGGKIDKSMNRSDASDYIKELQGRKSGTWMAEGDEPEPHFNDGVTGQDGPNAQPTNSQFSAEGCPSCGFAAEGDEPEPHFNDGVTGQDGPETEPSNSHFSAQGYDDKMDESMGMRNRGPHSQSMKDRRDEASAMDKGHSMMGRKYDDVSTMDAQGYDDKMDESMGMRNRGRHSQTMKDRRDEASAMDKGHSMMGRKYDDVSTMDAEHKHWHNKGNGQFYGKWSKHKKNGQFSTHNSEYTQLMGPTVEANAGGLHSPSSFDITWEDGSGLSSASMPPNEIHFADTHDADFTLEKPVKTGFMVAFGAGLFSLAAVAGTVLVGNFLGRDE